MAPGVAVEELELACRGGGLGSWGEGLPVCGWRPGASFLLCQESLGFDSELVSQSFLGETFTPGWGQ